GRRLQAASKTLGYLQSGGDAEALIAKARHHLVYNADEPHDYKFSEAVLDSYAYLPNSVWRCYFLSAGIAYFKAPAKRPGPVVEQMVERLNAVARKREGLAAPTFSEPSYGGLGMAKMSGAR